MVRIFIQCLTLEAFINPYSAVALKGKVQEAYLMCNLVRCVCLKNYEGLKQ